MKFDAYYNTQIQVVYLAEPGEPAPLGFMPLSEIEHCALNDIVGEHGYHALFSHVQKDLLEQAGLHNLVFWQIVDKLWVHVADVPKHIQDIADSYKDINSDDYYLHTWIPLEDAIYNVDPILALDVDGFTAHLQSLYDALIPKVKAPCNYPFSSTGSIEYTDNDNQLSIDTKEFGLVTLNHEADLAQDILDQPEVYEPRGDLYQGTGISTTGSNTYAMEFLVEELTDFTNIKIRLGASKKGYSKHLTLVLSRQYGFLSLRAYKDANGYSEYITTVANDHFLRQPRVGLWYNQVTKEVGFTVHNKHFSFPSFFDPSELSLIGISVEYLEDVDINSTLIFEERFTWDKAQLWADEQPWDVLLEKFEPPVENYTDYYSWDNFTLWEDGYVWDVRTYPYNNARIRMFKTTSYFQLAYPSGAVDLCGNPTLLTQYSTECLRELYNTTASINLTGYTLETAKALQEARYNASVFLTGIEMNQSAYLPIKQALFDAVANLRPNIAANNKVVIDPPTIDRSKLITALDNGHAELPNQHDYTPCTWNQLSGWLGRGLSTLNNPLASQFEIDKAVYWLDKTLGNLEIAVDRTDLILLMESVAGLNKIDYTPQSWLQLVNVTTEAQYIIDDPCNTDTGILARLQSTIDNLVLA